MKIKILSLVLTAILIISILTAITVYATVGNIETQEKNPDVKIEKTVSRNIDKIKILKLGNGETIELNYKKTRNLSLNRFLDDYCDMEGNTYTVNSHGELIGVDTNQVVLNKAKEDDISFAAGNGTPITEAEAIDLARDYASKIFGDRFLNFELYSVHESGGYLKYSFTFTENYGEDGFVSGSVCYCSVYSNGSIYSCSMPNRNEFNDFNEDCLKGITEEMLLEYATDAFNEVYGERLCDIEVTQIKLMKNEDKYSLAIIVGLEIAFEDPVTEDGFVKPCYSVGEVLYYALD